MDQPSDDDFELIVDGPIDQKTLDGGTLISAYLLAQQPERYTAALEVLAKHHATLSDVLSYHSIKRADL